MIVNFSSRTNFQFFAKTVILLGRAGGISHFVFQYFFFLKRPEKSIFPLDWIFFSFIVLTEPTQPSDFIFLVQVSLLFLYGF
jgi:hypothetical protein